MQYRINTDQKKIIGRRPNLSGENTVADEIVSVLSLPSEERPLPPLSALPTSSNSPRKRNPKGLCIAGTILLFLPFLYPIVFFVQRASIGYPLSALMYPLFVLTARYLSNVGGLFLYLAARKVNLHRKSIGWLAIVSFMLPIIGTILLGGLFFHADPGTITQIGGWIGIGFVIITLLCMLALCVFSILLLVRVFRKEKQSPTE